MPPHSKYTKKQLIDASVDIIRKEGADALTARNLAKKLGCSTRPIFTVYKDMNELKTDVQNEASRMFQDYIADYRQYTPAFKQMGINAIRFAIENPELYRFIYVDSSGAVMNIDELFEKKSGSNEEELQLIMKEYHLNKNQAYFLYWHIWTYTYGLCILISMKQCTFTQEEIIQMLGVEFKSLYMYVSSDQYKNETETPVKQIGGETE